jgi:hypothetical protein
LLDPIEDQSAREARGRPDACAKACIAGECTDNGAAAAPIAVPDSARCWVGVMSAQPASDTTTAAAARMKLFHRALRLLEASAGQGNLCDTPSFDGISSRIGRSFAHVMKLVSSKPLGGRGEGRQNSLAAPFRVSLASSTITAPSTNP